MKHITKTKTGTRNTYRIESKEVAKFFGPCLPEWFGSVIGDINGLTLSQARHIVKLLEVCGEFWGSRNPWGSDRFDILETNPKDFEALDILNLIEEFKERTKNMGSNSIAAAFRYMFHKEPKRTETRNGKHYGHAKKFTAFESFKWWGAIWEEFARLKWMTEMEEAEEFGGPHEVQELRKKYEARNKRRKLNEKKKREAKNSQASSLLLGF